MFHMMTAATGDFASPGEHPQAPANDPAPSSLQKRPLLKMIER
jgi:hypothetical protein